MTEALNDVDHDFREMAYASSGSIIQINSLYGHHIKSFNHFLSTLLPQILQEHSRAPVYNARKRCLHVVELTNMRYGRPSAENEAGVWNGMIARKLHAPKMTLLSAIIVDVRHRYYQATEEAPTEMHLQEDNMYKNHTLFHLPLMDGCDLTHDYDELEPVNRQRNQGTFVVNGHRKVIIVQTRVRSNYPFVLTMNLRSRYELRCETRSQHRGKLRSSSTLKMYLTREKQGTVPQVVTGMPFVPKKIPLTVMFRLVGVDTLAGMTRIICSSNSATVGSDSTAFRSAVRSMLINCPGRTDPLCASTTSTKDELFVWVARYCKGAQATGSSTTIANRSIQSHIASMKKLFCSELLPHLGADDDGRTWSRKATFLATAVRRLLLVHDKRRKPDEIDDGTHRRFTCAGQTLALKIRQLMRNFIKIMSASLTRCIENAKYVYIPDLMKGEHISRPVRSAMATGNFSVNQQQGSTQAGVSQVVNSMNRISQVSHMSTINLPLSRDGSQADAREMRPTSWGITCAAETPDGRNIGLVQHTTMFADFRVGYDTDSITAVVMSISGVEPVGKDNNNRIGEEYFVVIVNDEVVARVNDARELTDRLREMRRLLLLPGDLGVSLDEDLRQVCVHADEGDGIRPVLVVSKLDKSMELFKRYGKHYPHHLYPQLLLEGCVVLLNKEEEHMHATVAYSPEQIRRETNVDFQYIEFDPTTAMFGAIAGLIPFSNHNQGPRNIYFPAMSKQAIGCQHPMFDKYQLDVQSHALTYPQKSLAPTTTAKLTGIQEEPTGQIFVVAILPAMGLNQEDAIVGNKRSFQLGLAHTTKFTVIRDVEGIRGNDREIFCIPDPAKTSNLKHASSAALDEYGIPKKGATINTGDLVIGKVLRCNVQHRNPSTGLLETVEKIIDRSTVYKGASPCVVDSARILLRGEAQSMIVRLRSSHEIEVGDKLSSDAAQKGVLSAKLNPEDMVFTLEEGITPDIVIAGHGFTSRMTSGMLLEMVATHLAVVDGKVLDATSFRPWNSGRVKDAAKRGVGTKTFICGMTGEIIGQGFLGMARYMVQRHQVGSKIHARPREGPKNAITRQAVEGRSKDGGLKLGSMEVATIASSGASAVLQEFMTRHDGHECLLCQCGALATEKPPLDRQIVWMALVRPGERCSSCGKSGAASRIFVPYIVLQLKQELAGAGIDMKLIPGKHFVPAV